MFLTACSSKRTVTQDTAKSFEGVTIGQYNGNIVSSVTSFKAKWTPVGNLMVLVPDTSAPAFITNKTYNFNSSDTTKNSFQSSTFSNAVIEKEVSEPPLAEKSVNWFITFCLMFLIPIITYCVARFWNKSLSK